MTTHEKLTRDLEQGFASTVAPASMSPWAQARQADEALGVQSLWRRRLVPLAGIAATAAVALTAVVLVRGHDGNVQTAGRGVPSASASIAPRASGTVPSASMSAPAASAAPSGQPSASAVAHSGGAKPTSSAAPAVTCDVIAAPSTLAASISAAHAGQTVCLDAGDYGVWDGTSKAITIRPRPGTSSAMALRLTNDDANFTIDGGHTNNDATTPGLNLGYSTFEGTPGPQHVTIRNAAITGSDSAGVFLFEGPTNSGIVLDHDIFHDTNLTGNGSAVWIAGTSSSGITISNSLFRNTGAKAIYLGAAATISGNEFSGVADAIAIVGAGNALIAGNYIHGCADGITAYDGTSGNTIQDNVIIGCTGYSIILSSDRNPGSTVIHNTVIGSIQCESKAGAQPSTTSLVDNIATGGLVLTGGVGCAPAKNTHNLVPGGGGANLSGTPQFAGGATPTTFAGFKLASASAGRGAADDGADVGARFP